jgi:pimeloyl-ACP methyl ester carboxylesterase
MGFLQITDLGTVHFYEYGSGSKPMLAFHGYGMTGRQFHVLENSVLPHYHIYGFDHFFHGESELNGWTEKQILGGMPREMVRLYAEEWFKVYGRQRFSVMGYSIGANFALILVEEYPDLVDEIILMAPDGITGFKGFDILTGRPLGKLLFRSVTKSKWLAPFILRALKNTAIIDESLYKIAYSETDTPEKRLVVYYTLNLIRHLKPDTKKVADLINECKIKCTLIVGSYDRLFPMASATAFINDLNDADVHEAPFGHWLVTVKLDEYLALLPSPVKGQGLSNI